MEYIITAAGYIGIFGVGIILGCAGYLIYDFIRFIFDIFHDAIVIFYRELRRPN
jgi:hypothetical protein